MLIGRQGTTLMTAICAFIVILVVIQLWLVTASLEALLGGDRDVLAPAAIASAVLFAFNGALLLQALSYDRRTTRRAG
ncbi:MAG: DUF6755 family protein [Minicystis sp.]